MDHARLAQMAAPALEALITSAPAGVVLVSASGDVVAINDAFTSLCGLDGRADGLHRVDDLAAAMDVRDVRGAALPDGQSPVDIAASGGRLDETPLTLRVSGDGRARPVTCTVVPIHDGGAAVGAVIVVREPARGADQAALEESQAALRVLVADRERVQAEERRRIARDLHDELQQSLAALNMRLGMAEDVIDDDPAEARQWLQEAQRNVMDASSATRRIIEDLRPQGLYHRALVGALRDLGEAFSQRTGVRCEFEPVPAEMPEPPEEVADCIYRVAQESLTNIAKHADATRVTMRLEKRSDGVMHLSVADDGRGLDEPTARYREGSFGIIGMAERVRALNGEVRISGQPGRGTTVEADIPAPSAPTGRA